MTDETKNEEGTDASGQRSNEGSTDVSAKEGDGSTVTEATPEEVANALSSEQDRIAELEEELEKKDAYARGLQTQIKNLKAKKGGGRSIQHHAH